MLLCWQDRNQEGGSTRLQSYRFYHTNGGSCAFYRGPGRCGRICVPSRRRNPPQNRRIELGRRLLGRRGSHRIFAWGRSKKRRKGWAGRRSIGSWWDWRWSFRGRVSKLSSPTAKLSPYWFCTYRRKVASWGSRGDKIRNSESEQPSEWRKLPLCKTWFDFIHSQAKSLSRFVEQPRWYWLTRSTQDMCSISLSFRTFSSQSLQSSSIYLLALSLYSFLTQL